MERQIGLAHDQSDNGQDSSPAGPRSFLAIDGKSGENVEKAVAAYAAAQNAAGENISAELWQKLTEATGQQLCPVTQEREKADREPQGARFVVRPGWTEHGSSQCPELPLVQLPSCFQRASLPGRTSLGGVY